MISSTHCTIICFSEGRTGGGGLGNTGGLIAAAAAIGRVAGTGGWLPGWPAGSCAAAAEGTAVGWAGADGKGDAVIFATGACIWNLKSLNLLIS